jgi:adenylate cyclase, class 2
MEHINVEIKAKTKDLTQISEYLFHHKVVFTGIDYQTDTYFKASAGRLKLQHGNVENALIFYKRENLFGTKRSDIILQNMEPDNKLWGILTESMGVVVEVKKKWEIFLSGM